VRRKEASSLPARWLRIRLVKSPVGYPEKQRATVRGLGLRRLNSEVIKPDRPEIWGMIEKIPHLVKVEIVEEN